ncbi:MAG: hypothetical protein HXS54_01175 [Theionarchaea archaeon]|nr:hypothetical protein [Theionarchaea archaeon]
MINKLYGLTPSDITLLILHKYIEAHMEDLIGDTCSFCRYLRVPCDVQTAKNSIDTLLTEGLIIDDSGGISLSEKGKVEGKKTEQKYLLESQTTLDEFFRQRRWPF